MYRSGFESILCMEEVLIGWRRHKRYNDIISDGFNTNAISCERLVNVVMYFLGKR